MILEVDSSCSEVQTESLSLHVIQRYPNFSLLTLFPTEGCVCVFFTSQTNIANYGVFCLSNMLFYYLTFHIRGLPNFWRKNNLTFFGWNPPFRPLKYIKISEFSKLTPHDFI